MPKWIELNAQGVSVIETSLRLEVDRKESLELQARHSGGLAFRC